MIQNVSIESFESLIKVALQIAAPDILWKKFNKYVSSREMCAIQKRKIHKKKSVPKMQFYLEYQQLRLNYKSENKDRNVVVRSTNVASFFLFLT